MDGAAAVMSEKISQVPLRDAKTAQLMERLERLLQEAAEVEVELSRAEGTIAGLPHYSVIEGRAHALGRRRFPSMAIGGPNVCCGPSSAVRRVPATSVGRWPARRNGGVFPRLPPAHSWGMACPVRRG